MSKVLFFAITSYLGQHDEAGAVISHIETGKQFMTTPAVEGGNFKVYHTKNEFILNALNRYGALKKLMVTKPPEIKGLPLSEWMKPKGIRLHITWKDFENGPKGHLGHSWRSGRSKITYPTSSAGRRSAQAMVKRIETVGRKWGRVAVINRQEQS